MRGLSSWIKIIYCLQKTPFKDIEYLMQKNSKIYIMQTQAQRKLT